MQAYTGKYASDLYGDAEITLRDGNLFVKFPNNNILKLEHWNYDIFKGSFNNFWWDKSSVQFFLNNDGKVSHFEMDGLRYDRATDK